MASRPAALLSTLLLCLHGVPFAWGLCSNATQLSVQVDTLLAEYDREAPPAGRVLVTLALDVRHATVDEAHAVMRLLADLKMRSFSALQEQLTWYGGTGVDASPVSWQEPRVQWNVSEWGCDSALTAAERLWLPDVVLLNAASTGAGDAGLRARLDAAGAVSWVTRLDVAVPLNLDLHAWPRDTQACVFKFGSRAYNDDELSLAISEFKHAVVFESGAWEIQKVTGSSATWQRGPEEVGVATWTVSLARRAPAQALAAGAVLLAGALLLAAAALLPPAQRPALAATASFTAALWLMSTLVRLPGSSSAPRGLCVMCALCACGALSGAGAALVLRLARCSAPPPRALRALLSSLSTVCKLTPAAGSCISSESGAWAAAALLLDRVWSLCIALTLLVLVAVQLS